MCLWFEELYRVEGNRIGGWLVVVDKNFDGNMNQTDVRVCWNPEDSDYQAYCEFLIQENVLLHTIWNTESQ